MGETTIFRGGQRGGPVFFFSGPKGGDQNFLRVKEGGTKIGFPKAKGGGTRIFPRRQRGPKFFYAFKGGDQKQLATSNHRQTASPSR